MKSLWDCKGLQILTVPDIKIPKSLVKKPNGKDVRESQLFVIQKVSRDEKKL